MLIDHVIGGKYRISELIGQGGMGTVFEAVHTGTGSRVAIKVIVSKDVKEEVFVRFQREARAAGAIDSRHIVRIFDMGTDERTGSPYMVMERLVGEDLSQLMRRVGPLSPDVALQILHQTALGLAKAHDQGVVHRDIKPANLFLHDEGDHHGTVVKILDFGIAKVRMDLMQKADEGGLTRTGSMLGSPHYMSPEQAQGLRSIDHRSDVWSLGVVLYKMLTGQTPHSNLHTLGQVILAICSTPPRSVQEVAPWVPPEVAYVVHRALQADPAQRFQSAVDFARAIEPLLPHAQKLDRSTIRSLSDTQRARVQALAPTAFRQDSQPSGTYHGTTQSHVPAAPRSGVGLMIAMGFASAFAAMGIAAIGISLMAKKPAAAAPNPSAPAVASVASVAVPVAEPAPTPTPVPAPPTPPVVEERAVTVSVPAGATVDVDGKKLPVVSGKVELKGSLGSVQSVHVTTSAGEATQNVAITEGGAIPAKIAVTKSSRGKGGAGPSPAPSGTGVNVQRNFE